MAEQLESLKYTFREHGREAVVAQLRSCAQKVLRATTKAAGLAQQVSGRSLTTEELRQNLLEHALAATQVGVGWLGFLAGCVESWFNGTLLHVLRGQIARMNISFRASDRSALEFDEYMLLLVAWFMSAKIQHQDQCVI